MADVLEVSEVLSLKIVRNGETPPLYFQPHRTTPRTFTRHANDRVVLPANMGGFSQVNLGDIGVSNPGKDLMIVVDRAITIAVNDTARYIEADTLIMIGATGITALYVKNTDPTNTATMDYIVTN